MMYMIYLTGGILTIFLFASVFYYSGPRVSIKNLNTVLPELNSKLSELENFVKQNEASYGDNIKPGNESVIIWADEVPSKTAYSIVYFHGWSASREEGAPLHVDTAKRFHCNLYLPRLANHGLKDVDSMRDLTAEDLLESAKEALAVAAKLGDKVIVMATSTGASVALYLAGENSCIAGLVMYSPNIKIYTTAAKLLSGPWGLQVARMINGDYFEFEADTERQKYWTNRYNIEALPQLQALLDHTMVPRTFKKVEQPVFMGYYYKNEEEQDKVVSVSAMLRMYNQLGTPDTLKHKKAFPEVGHHVIASHILSKDLTSVKKETFYFLENKMGLRPVKP
jgi:pimeloyl-ACP methyl ester carboxylesterase